MAVVSVNEELAQEVTANDSNRRDYVRSFIVTTDNPTDSEDTVRLASGIPSLFSVHPSNLKARATQVHASRLSNSNTGWRVSVDYSTEPSGQTPEDEDPLLRPADVSFSFDQSTEEIATAYELLNPLGQTALAAMFPHIASSITSGQIRFQVSQWDLQKGTTSVVVGNSAGQLFDPPVTRSISTPRLTIVRNESSFDVALAIDFMDAVNSDVFFGAQPGQAKISNISATSQFENDVSFQKVTYDIQFKYETFHKVLRDVGTLQFDKSAANANYVIASRVSATDADGKPHKTPVDFDGFGFQPSSSPIAASDPAGVAYRAFRIYKERPFSQLNLP